MLKMDYEDFVKTPYAHLYVDKQIGNRFYDKKGNHIGEINHKNTVTLRINS